MAYYRRTEKARERGRKLRRALYLLLSLLLIALVAAAVLAGRNQSRTADPGKGEEQTEASAGPPAVQEWTLAASGDVMLGRRVAEAMARDGAFYPFAEVAPLLRSADITFGNLESSLSEGGTPLPGKGIWLRGSPRGAGALREAGYDVLSVANNHILDYDDPAFLDTLDYLRQQGIAPVGGGANLEEAVRPVIREVKGQRVAFLAATEMADIFWSWDYPRTFEAKPDRPGVFRLDSDRLSEAVSSLQGEADLIVVSLHWGTEYSDYATEAQRETAHRLVEAGANLIIGHHPHCLQGVEIYRGSLIAYSLGNFVYDKQRLPKCQEGLLLKASFQGPLLKKVHIYPVVIEKEQPRLADGEAADAVLRRTAELSRELGTSMTLANGVGVIELDRGDAGSGEIGDS